MGEIVRLIDYLAGRSSGQYMPDNPFWYKRNNHNIGSVTVADTVGDTFNPKQAPLGTSQYSTSPMYPSRQIMDESYGTSLPRSAINKYPQYCPDGLLQWIIISCVNGDNQLLDDKLEQLRTIDRRLNGWS
jgi:hypothetical protein